MKKPIRILIGGNIIWAFAEGMFGPLLAIFTKKIGGSTLDIAWAWATYLLVTGTMVIVVGYLSDRFRKDLIMLSGYALNVFATFSYLMVDDQRSLLVVQVMLGLAVALSMPTWEALFSYFIDNESSGLEWGIVSGLDKILTGVGILLGGLLVKYMGFDTLFIIMGSVQCCALIYQTRILKYSHAKGNSIS